SAASDSKPSAPKRKLLGRRKAAPAAAETASAPLPPAKPAPVAKQSKPVKPAPAPASRRQQRDETYADAAFPAKSRFWPAFWRFLFLLILLGLIITLGVYIYFSYYQG
ncbi:MAG TPA: hypothetical protein VMR98_00755, partial [Candidatus Polarisedimenticolaceae bacterium]|nr:hypothetical protein [Candidatus Polarisedimenticolaceae bacterium]